MTHQEISEAIDAKQIEIISKGRSEAIKGKEMLRQIARLQFLYHENGIINIPDRLLALLIICDVLPHEARQRRKTAKAFHAIGFAWDQLQILTSQSFVAECLETSQPVIARAHESYINSRKRKRA